jgi:hypothetical protein
MTKTAVAVQDPANAPNHPDPTPPRAPQPDDTRRKDPVRSPGPDPDPPRPATPAGEPPVGLPRP